jgi:4-hydroxy-3-polyprenylbenzoate decarboxylase
VNRQPWIVGVSGASGSPYAVAVTGALLDAGLPVDLVISKSARLTIIDETGLRVRDAHWKDDVAAWLSRDLGDLVYWNPNDLAAGPSSGSYPVRGMIVVPASAAAVAGIALGLSKDLLQRSASVTLKEGRPLVVVPREAPYTRALMEQMIVLHDAGAVIVPASPGFYAGASEVAQLVDFVAAKILDLIGVEHDLVQRWTGTLGAARITDALDQSAAAVDGDRDVR